MKLNLNIVTFLYIESISVIEDGSREVDSNVIPGRDPSSVTLSLEPIVEPVHENSVGVERGGHVPVSYRSHVTGQELPSAIVRQAIP